MHSNTFVTKQHQIIEMHLHEMGQFKGHWPRHELTDEALRMSSPSTVVSLDLSAAPRDPT